jgi:hypothetical protein
MQFSSNWIIISPGRTGSRYIADVYSIFYRETFGVDTKYLGPGSEFDPHAHWQFFHTHDPTKYVQFKKNARCILSIRDMVDAALSYCIVEHTNLYHIFKNTDPNEIPSVQKIHISKEDFIGHYAYQVSFYRQVRDIIDDKTVVIRYNSILEDWRAVLWDAEIPINMITPAVTEKVQELAPVKNSWKSEDWILNWDEIEPLTKMLPRKPEPFFGK